MLFCGSFAVFKTNFVYLYSTGYPSRGTQLESIPLLLPRCLNMVFCIFWHQDSKNRPPSSSIDFLKYQRPPTPSDESKHKIPAKRGQKRICFPQQFYRSRPTVHPKFAGRGARDLFHLHAEKLGSQTTNRMKTRRRRRKFRAPALSASSTVRSRSVYSSLIFALTTSPRMLLGSRLAG